MFGGHSNEGYSRKATQGEKNVELNMSKCDNNNVVISSVNHLFTLILSLNDKLKIFEYF